jgi:hypothetical protein
MKVDMSETPVVSANEVIVKRQNELTVEIFALDAQIAEKEKELEALRLRRAERMMEYDMWDNYNQRSSITITRKITETTVEMNGRMGQADRMRFEDCLKAIMKEAGVPLQFGDIRKRLEKFGIIWNDYSSAHNYIIRSGLLEGAGRRGFYQLMKPRF